MTITKLSYAFFFSCECMSICVCLVYEIECTMKVGNDLYASKVCTGYGKMGLEFGWLFMYALNRIVWALDSFAHCRRTFRWLFYCAGFKWMSMQPKLQNWNKNKNQHTAPNQEPLQPTHNCHTTESWSTLKIYAAD